MATRDLLFEIGTEELPPKTLSSLSESLEELLIAKLQHEQLDFSTVQRFATPRRLAVLVSSLQDCQADKIVERLGPATRAAFDDKGEATPAALGFAKSCGVDVTDLSTLEKGGIEKLAFSSNVKGKTTQELLPELVKSCLSELPVSKRMRWGSSREEFVRPVHWAVLLFGTEPVSVQLLGVESGNSTYGHRFHHNQEIVIKDASDYEELLEETGGVIPDFDKRKELIRRLVTEEGVKASATAVIDVDLLDEVTGLVEYPVALAGKFEEHFLDVPAEALILTMKSHQKCFYLVDEDKNLLPGFITVSNIVSKDPAQVIEGNERVIRPRLADARFFYETDKQQTLESRSEQLKTVIFQEKLGTIYDKSERVSCLSQSIADQLGGNKAHCSRAARLSKCDLLTNMVGEFADLQGLMGYYYALNDGEPEEVARAINEQYKPRFAGDQLPQSLTGSILAIADKLDSMVGMFGIGQPPTGSKDPFALRRSAIGILRIIIEKEMDLNILQCIEMSVSGYGSTDLAPNTAITVFDFMLDRFRAWYVDEGISSDVFQAVFTLRPPQPLDFHKRVLAVHNFSELPEAAALAAANKRVSNLLSKQEDSLDNLKVDEELLQETAEKSLFQKIDKKVLEVTPLFEQGNYKEGLQALATLRVSVDTFFDEVLVMCDDASLRTNRLALLQKLHDLFLQTADISCLHNA